LTPSLDPPYTAGTALKKKKKKSGGVWLENQLSVAEEDFTEQVEAGSGD